MVMEKQLERVNGDGDGETDERVSEGGDGQTAGEGKWRWGRRNR